VSEQLILPGMPRPTTPQILWTPHESVGRIGTLQRTVHRREGRVIWASGIGELDLNDDEWALEAPYQPWYHNYLADGGEQSILDVYFRDGTEPSLYIALLAADPGETGTLVSMTENTGTGYARIQLNRNTTDFPTLALDSGDYKVTSASKVFTAGGAWSACTHLAIVTAATGTSGVLILVNALGATRSLINTDTLTVTVAIKLQ